MVPSQYGNSKNLDDLYDCPWFFGVLSEEKAKEILEETMKNDNNSKAKTIIFLKSGFDNLKKIQFFTIVLGHLSQYSPNGQPQFYLHNNHNFSILRSLVMRKNPFSLEVLTTVKIATPGVNPETLKLPKMIEDEVKNYQAFIKTSTSSMCIEICILEVCLYSHSLLEWIWIKGSYLSLWIHRVKENPLRSQNNDEMKSSMLGPTNKIFFSGFFFFSRNIFCSVFYVF